MAECNHSAVYFGSGGFYVFCVYCGEAWVAKKAGGKDRDIDHNRKTPLRGYLIHKDEADGNKP